MFTIDINSKDVMKDKNVIVLHKSEFLAMELRSPVS